MVNHTVGTRNNIVNISKFMSESSDICVVRIRPLTSFDSINQWSTKFVIDCVCKSHQVSLFCGWHVQQ